MKQYELKPTNGRKSFYGKAVVKVADDGTETLYSYGTAIIKRTPAGELLKNPHTVTKSGTWNSEHKVLTINEPEPGEDGYRYGFQVDLVTMSICG